MVVHCNRNRNIFSTVEVKATALETADASKRNLIAMASNLRALAPTLVAMLTVIQLPGC